MVFACSTFFRVIVWVTLGFWGALFISFPVFSIANPFIMSQGNFTLLHIVTLINRYNPTLQREYVERVARTYLETSLAEGVNQDIALAQMFLETAFLKFPGIVGKEQNNFAGLGATDPTAVAESFAAVEEGVKAHIQHLKGYASKKPFTESIYDTRLKYLKRGSVRTVFELTGTWATDEQYAHKIVRILRMLNQDIQREFNETFL